LAPSSIATEADVALGKDAAKGFTGTPGIDVLTAPAFVRYWSNSGHWSARALNG
jgi:hypothetical protein